MLEEILQHFNIFPIRIDVQLIIINNKKVLLVKHRYTSQYYFPGGGVKKNESLETAVKREIFEELGIKLKKTRFYHFFEYYQDNRQDYIFLFNTDEILPKTKIKIDKFEILKYHWFSLSQITKYKKELSPATFARLQEYPLKSNSEIKSW